MSLLRGSRSHQAQHSGQDVRRELILLLQLRLRVGRALVGRVAAHLALEVHLRVAPGLYGPLPSLGKKLLWLARASAVVTPSHTPESISWRLTQPSKVCGTQPIFGAIDSIAAHSEGYSPR